MTKSIRRIQNRRRSIHRNKVGGMSYLSSWFSPPDAKDSNVTKKTKNTPFQVRMKTKYLEYLGTVIAEDDVPEEFRTKVLLSKDGVNYKHGQGQLTIKNPDKSGDVIYIGEFKYDKKDGEGELFNEELKPLIIEDKNFGFCKYRYSGSWKNDKKHGKGIETWYRPPDLFAYFTKTNEPDLLPVYTREGNFKNDEYVGHISRSKSRSRSGSASASASHLRLRRSF